jgi:hypothetical protein
MRYRVAVIGFVSLLLSAGAAAQDLAELTISVVDPSAAMVPGAKVTVVDAHRGTVREAVTREDGQVEFDSLNPSDYAVDVVKTGFNRYHIDRVTLALRARESVHVALTLSAAAGAKVDVVASVDVLSTDPAQGASLEQNYLSNLPVNGRNVESLILLAPGMSTAAGGKGDGGFNANGLRSNMNYYTLDGVSMNQSISGAGGGGGFGRGGGGGGLAAGTDSLLAGAGGSTALISIDTMQEMRVQTASVAPEFGRSPGAQIVMTSRSGTNNFHGVLYYYLRNNKFDANDFFANAGGYGKGKERQNRPGIAAGGPIVKNRTFFFISFEELRLTAPETLIANVPDAATRLSAPTALLPYLKAFPIANGPELTNGAALYQAVVSNPTRSSTGSVRLDQLLTPKMTLFARYSLTPSDSERRGSDVTSPNLLTNQNSRSQTATVGLTRTFSNGVLNDLRLNYSKSTANGQTIMDNYGGAIPLSDSLVFPKGVTSADASFNLNILGFAGYSYGARTSTDQAQINVVDSVSKSAGDHQLKAGVDFRRVMVTNHREGYSESASFDGLNIDSYSFLAGTALNAQVSSNVGTVYPTYNNFSAYGQDTWHMSQWTTITFGARWDVNPAPYARTGPQPFALSNDPIAGVTQNTPLYATRWYNVAPRVGVAYNMDERRGHEMMLRAGFGFFYDTGYGVSGGAFNGAPFTNVDILSQVAFPLIARYLAPPGLPATRPYGQITAADTGLLSPVVWQWNATWEKNFGVGQTLSVGYSGNNGRNLLRTETQPNYTGAYDIAVLATNGASSVYNGLQLQYKRRMSTSLQMQASYTWSHSIDSASTDAGGGGGFATLFTGGERGSSDYDIRHNLSVSGSYRIAAPDGILFSPLRHWALDFYAWARTGLPFDIIGQSTTAGTTTTTQANGTTTTSSGLFAQVRPDWNGEAIWIDDPHAPGGRRLNENAFFIPSGYNQGNLGRNSFRGFGASQLDLALRREFPITERIRFNIAAQAYNVFNHPNFANPSPQQGANLASPDFGVMTHMLNQGFGGSVNSLYRSGGPRSMELSLRLQF